MLQQFCEEMNYYTAQYWDLLASCFSVYLCLVVSGSIRGSNVILVGSFWKRLASVQVFDLERKVVTARAFERVFRSAVVRLLPNCSLAPHKLRSRLLPWVHPTLQRLWLFLQQFSFCSQGSCPPKPKFEQLAIHFSSNNTLR